MIPFQWLRPPSVREPQFAPTGCRLASLEASSGIIAKQIQRQRHKDKYTGCRLASVETCSGIIAKQRQKHTDKDKYTGCRLASVEASSGIIAKQIQIQRQRHKDKDTQTKTNTQDAVWQAQVLSFYQRHHQTVTTVSYHQRHYLTINVTILLSMSLSAHTRNLTIDTTPGSAEQNPEC